jgi:hypothetical protein
MNWGLGINILGVACGPLLACSSVVVSSIGAAAAGGTCLGISGSTGAAAAGALCLGASGQIPDVTKDILKAGGNLMGAMKGVEKMV